MLVQGRYVLEVRLNGYDNQENSCVDCQPEGRMRFGCCDDHNRNNGDCSGNRPCDSYFIFCLRPFGSERVTYDCRTLYNDTKVTSVNNNDGPVDFTDEIVLGLENPFLLPGLTEEYEVSNCSYHFELSSLTTCIYREFNSTLQYMMMT